MKKLIVCLVLGICLTVLGAVWSEGALAMDVTITVPVKLVNIPPGVTVSVMGALTTDTNGSGCIAQGISNPISLQNGSFIGNVTIKINIPDELAYAAKGYGAALLFNSQGVGDVSSLPYVDPSKPVVLYDIEALQPSQTFHLDISKVKTLFKLK